MDSTTAADPATPAKAPPTEVPCQHKTLPTKEETPILYLPVEMVHAIDKFLKPEHSIMLSLTCKALFYTLPAISSRKLTNRSKREMFRCLDRALETTHMSCTSCMRLHPLHKDAMGEPLSLTSLQGVCSGRSFAPFKVWTRGYRDLNQQGLCLLNRYHERQSPHGVTVEQLLGDRAHLDALHSMTTTQHWTTEMEAKTIKAGLILKATHTLRGVTVEHILTHQDLADFPLCTHTRAFGTRPKGPSSTVKSAISLKHGFPWEPKRGCRLCLSDWDIKTDKSVSGELTVICQSYHLLGKVCSSHTDIPWLLLAGGEVSESKTEYFYNKYPLGEVAKIWDNGAEDDTDDTEDTDTA